MSIEWQTAGSWNPVVGCSIVSPGCASCYAMKQAYRNFKFGTRGYEDVVKATPQGARWTGNVNFIPGALAKPLGHRKPALWFVNSMSDLFHEKVTNEQIAAVLGIICATGADQQHFVVLTKRIERVPLFLRWLTDFVAHLQQHPKYPTSDAVSPAEACVVAARCALAEGWDAPPAKKAKGDTALARPCHEWPPRNLWIGPSIENQDTCRERLPVAAALGKMRFNTVLSIEPLLGPVTLNEGLLRAPITRLDHEQAVINERQGIKTFAAPQYTSMENTIGWVLLGGESDQGADARPYYTDWARPIIKQCANAKIPLFHKQLGSNVWEREISSWPQGASVLQPGFNLTGDGFGNHQVSGIKDRRGGDPNEWPEDLRVRQAPESLRPILEAASRLTKESHEH